MTVLGGVNLAMRWLLLVLLLLPTYAVATVERSAALLRDVDARVVALNPGDPGNADVLLTWQAFDKSEYDHAGDSDPVVAYEVQSSVAGTGAWDSLSAAVSGMASSTPTGLPPRRDRHERQRVFTRADAGETIGDGFFRLAVSHAGTSTLDMHQHSVTPPIAFDASESDVKRALETLDVVTTVQVFRRTLDASAGTLEWIVLFDPQSLDSQTDHGDLPLLTLYAETISAIYSGAGDQVAIESDRDGAFENPTCVDDCEYLARGLRAGETRAFRVRAQFAARGWSGWSHMSAPIEIPKTPLPRAPSSPELLSASTSRLTVQWTSAETPGDVLFPVRSFHLQQRCERELSWRTVNAALPPGRTRVTVGISSIVSANTSCSFRVSAANANGVGPFSVPSALFTTQAAAPTSPPRQLIVDRVPALRLSWQPPDSDGGSRIVTYELELRTFASSTWQRIPELDGSARNWSPTPATPLEPFTRYVARIRARNAVGTSDFAEFPHFLTDFIARNETKTRSSETVAGEIVVVVASASRTQAAHTDDLQYVHGIAFGAQLRGADGDHGAVLVFPITFDGERLDEQAYFFTGTVQMLRIARAESPRRQIVAIDAYAWGAGGGSGDKAEFGTGGGGAFARGVFRVSAGDTVQILVGGGGWGATRGGRGGWNGGGDGGTGAFAGGGGGGRSEVRVNDKAVLVAGGGGGGGASDYCCAHGGGGGGAASAPAEDGLWPDATSIPLDARITGLMRNEYHSVNVEGDIRDFVGLPARHAHLDYGFSAASADYTTLATGGGGASTTQAGVAGRPASFVVSRVGKCFYSSDKGALIVGASMAAEQATPGRRGRGGKGQDGQDCGGGGGAGYFGGGGGGAGVDGAGGGGGSSFVAIDALFSRPRAMAARSEQQERVANFSVRATMSTTVELAWSPPPFGFIQPVEGFVVELANRSANEDFRVKRVLPATATGTTLEGLKPAWWYRVRVRPLFRDAARGVDSETRAVQTLSPPVHTWRRVQGVRGLDERTTHAGMRVVDALPLRRFPSARRGHTLTAFDDGFLYLFGGFSAGYACNQAHKARCVVASGVSNELWRFDTRTRGWLELGTVGGPPPAREKHTMAVVASHLLLFGGRQGGGGTDDTATALNDLWSLKISSTTRKTTTATLQNRESSLALRDGQETFTIANVGYTPDMCVADMVVSLDLTHACAQTLRIELLGPGPSTHPQRQQTATTPVDSQTLETTWSDAAGFGTGQQRTTPTAASARSFPVTLQRPEMASVGSACLSGRRTLSFGSSGTQPLESLAVFRQFSASGGWTLSVLDTALDGKTGTLNSWDISFTLVPCVPSWTWTNVGVVATGTAPSARWQHTAITYQSSMFVFGGREATSARPLTDLYRFDYNSAGNTGAWTTLMPVTTYRDKTFYHGRALLVTPYELLAIGLGLRSRATSSEPHVLSSAVYVARKSVTETLAGWQALRDVQIAPEDDEAALPLGRYWSSAAFTSEPTPRVFMFGGQDDTSLMSDLWVLQLDAFLESDPSASLEARRLETCSWRLANAALQQKWAASCGATAATTMATECSLDALLLYAWCAKTYQTVQL